MLGDDERSAIHSPFEQETNDMIADALGFALDENKRTKHEVAVATKSIGSPIGPIELGRVVCQASPGTKSYLDLPLVVGRAAPGLAS